VHGWVEDQVWTARRVATLGRPGPFTSAQVASFHIFTASSSRSATRRTGTCGENPSRCISRVAPETL
jgi:hypothetical protein